jgi:hypothetical protein
LKGAEVDLRKASFDGSRTGGLDQGIAVVTSTEEGDGERSQCLADGR